MLSRYNHLSAREWLIAAGLLLGAFALVFVIRYYTLYGPGAIELETNRTLYLEENISVEQLADRLQEHGVEFDRDRLLWASRILRLRNMDWGRYRLQGSYSHEELLGKLAFGQQDPVRMRVPPGYMQDRLIRTISSQMHFDRQDLEQAFEDEELLEDLGVGPQQLLGRMLPNTYEMFWTHGPEQVLRRLNNEFERRVVENYRDRAEELDMSIDEITTLASIVEWEAYDAEEKPTISGLYWNRLNQNWRMQADPTVIYAVGERRRLTYTDYRVDHPYNTYQMRGLPPGPVTNPSYRSIRAALYPEEHDYMFMVATPDGGHAFTQTYAEHRQKSREWTEWLREQRLERDRREAEAEAAAGETENHH